MAEEFAFPNRIAFRAREGPAGSRRQIDPPSSLTESKALPPAQADDGEQREFLAVRWVAKAD
jgi:hypothetical protein